MKTNHKGGKCQWEKDKVEKTKHIFMKYSQQLLSSLDESGRGTWNWGSWSGTTKIMNAVKKEYYAAKYTSDWTIKWSEEILQFTYDI